MKSWVMVGIHAKELYEHAKKKIEDAKEDDRPVVFFADRHLDAHLVVEMLEGLGVT